MTRFLSFTIFTLLLCLSLNSVAATLSSTVNRNTLSTNETLSLRVSIDEQVDTSSLDLTELEKDFEVLGVSPQTRSSLSFGNGPSSQQATTVWSISLIPKRQGKLVIPAFRIGNTSSKAIIVDVNNASQSNGISNVPLTAKLSYPDGKLYPNQQFIVTIELSAAADIRDLNGQQLLIPNADVEPIDQQSFRRVDNGIARQIVILKYAVFAKKAGTLSIPVTTFSGLKNAQRGIFGSRGDQVLGRTEAHELTIVEAPSNTQNNGRKWFAAENVEIKSTWSSDISTLKVGSPITRIITVTAVGQQASAIPPLEQSSTPPGLKAYDDKPQLDTVKSTEGFIGTRIESKAIVASKAGEYLISGQSIDWWNTKTNTWETASIESETLVVSGSAVADTEAGSNNAQVISNDISQSSTISLDDHKDSSNALPWKILSAVLTVICLILGYLLYRKPTTNNQSRHKLVAENISEKAAWAALDTQLQKNSGSREIREAIIKWGNIAYNDSEMPSNMAHLSLKNIAELARSTELTEQLEALDRQLYTNDSSETHYDQQQLKTTLAAFRAELNRRNKLGDAMGANLKPLYPS